MRLIYTHWAFDEQMANPRVGQKVEARFPPHFLDRLRHELE